jgi:hypothetical protein
MIMRLEFKAKISQQRKFSINAFPETVLSG